MGWRDNLREASFRGVPFHFEDASGPVGRRFVAHEYAARDGAYHEDLGRRPREFTIRAYVIGADYMAARDRLIEAIEAPGPGTLVHPYRGAFRAVCTAAMPREAARAGGMASFELTFAEDGDNRFPVPTENSQAIVGSVADSGLVDIAGAFATAFTAAGQPSWVAGQATALLGDGLDALDGPAGRIAADSGSAAAFARALAAAKADKAALVTAPAGLAATVIGLIGDLAGLGDAKSGLAALDEIDLFGADVAPQPETTAARLAAGENQAALIGLFLRPAAIESARAAAAVGFASRDAATTVRDRLAARLDSLMIEAGDAGDDAAWSALAKLRAAMVRDINRRGARLPRLVSVTPATVLPALVIAQNLYGDDASGIVGRADEIVALNDIRHPGFVPAGEALSVLTLEAANG